MKIEAQPLEDHQVKLVVEVEQQPFEQAKRQAASRLSRRTKIPGFRPGKAPYHIVQRHIGEEAILDESLEILLKDIYPKIIDEAEIEPHGPGKLDNIVSIEPLKLEFVVPLAAEVELGDYASIRFPYEPEEVTEEDVQDVLEDIRQRQAVDEPVDRPAQEGDRVSIRLSAERAIVEEGEDSTLVAERPQSLVIAAEDQEDEKEWPFTGFSRQLIGMSPGDEKTLTHSFPQDSDFESLQGVTAQFHVQMEDVKSRTLPELNDELAQSVGEYESLEELRADVRETLERQTKEAYDDEYDDKVLTAIIEDSTVKFPPQMLEEEIDEVIHQLEHRLQSQNLDLDTYLMTRDLTEEGLREEVQPVAESRLERSLVLLEISEQENIEVPPEAVQQETERALDVLSRSMSEEDLQKISTEQLVPNLVSNIMVDMKINRTLERLRSIAKGEAEAVEAAEEETPVEAESKVEPRAEDLAEEMTEEQVEHGAEQETASPEGEEGVPSPVPADHREDSDSTPETKSES